MCRPTSYSTQRTFFREEELFERARTFQDSLEAAYTQDHPASDGTLPPDYCRALELQEQLSQYYKELLGCKGANGVAGQGNSNFVAA